MGIGMDFRGEAVINLMNSSRYPSPRRNLLSSNDAQTVVRVWGFGWKILVSFGITELVFCVSRFRCRRIYTNNSQMSVQNSCLIWKQFQVVQQRAFPIAI